MKTSRHTFLASTLAAGTSQALKRKTQSEAEQSAFDLMKEVKKYRKLDAHAHVGFERGDEKRLLDFAERLEIEKLCMV